MEVKPGNCSRESVREFRRVHRDQVRTTGEPDLAETMSQQFINRQQKPPRAVLAVLEQLRLLMPSAGFVRTLADISPRTDTIAWLHGYPNAPIVHITIYPFLTII
jgi:hypothetical protein